MTILLSLLRAYWKQVVGAILLIIVLTMTYNFIYDRGVTASNIKWEAKFAEQEKIRAEQITSIEGFTKITLEQTLINNDKMKADLESIYSRLKGKSTTVIKEGKCTPSPDFISTYNEIINRGITK